VKIVSREITYRSVVEQVFFEDDSELILTIGWPEGQEGDLDITHQWATGEEPDWAKGMTSIELERMQ
jgi:hypothetical protein